MIDFEIENYLKKKNIKLDTVIIDEIKERKTKAQNEKNEEKANYYWFLEQVYKVQNDYLKAFNCLITQDYENAWMLLDHADINIAFLDSNCFINNYEKKFHIDFIGAIIPEYQKLFPYSVFTSRESIIKEEKCSICGQKISLRNSCGHIPGKVYMGELCLRMITDFELKGIALVNDPFDKYALVKISGEEFNYSLLEEFTKMINNPYDKFSVSIEKRIKPEYKNVGRNSLCPCGSGKKYKKCHLGTADELMDHYQITFYKTNKTIL